MKCVNRQKPNCSGTRVRGSAGAPPAQQHLQALPTLSGQETPPEALAENHETTDGETKAQRKGNDCRLQGYESMAEAGLG